MEVPVSISERAVDSAWGARMSLELSTKFEGGKELENALKQLPKALKKSALRSMLRKVAKPVLQEAKSKVPVDSGGLRDSLAIGTTLTKRQRKFFIKTGDAQIFIGAGKGGAHAHLVEFGTSMMSARPFLRPAWDAKKHKLLKDAQKILWTILAKKAKTLAKKAVKGTLSKSSIKGLS